MRKIVSGIAVLFIATSAMADFTQCENMFYKIPQYSGRAQTIELCNTEYATLYSPQIKTPMFSYEHITDNNQVKRQGTFKTDTRLPSYAQSTNKDYTNSGYDRGHIAPSGDMTTVQSQNESFLFSNIAPQASRFNQQQWRLLEASVKHKYPYVITGVIYQGSTIKTIGNNVGIPTQFYKIVTNGQCATAYMADNNNTAVINKVPVHEIESLTNIDFFLPTTQCN